MDTIERTDYRKATAEIMEATDFSKEAVYTAIHNYEESGIKALRLKKRGRKAGEKRTLTANQEKEILTLLVDKNPEQLKMRGCMWTRSRVKELIDQKYGIIMPVRTVGEYLRRWGLTVQRPAKREANQKPEQVEAWLKEQYPAIHAEAKAEDAEIYRGDETTVQNTANYARGYAPKGQTSVVKVQAKKMHINMISAINNQGKLHFLLYSDAINSDRLISFMEALVKTDAGRKVYLILDNLRVHHSNKVTAWTEAHEAQIRLFHLPPYSPEYNPDEYLNNDLKQNPGSQSIVKNVDELEANTTESMENWLVVQSIPAKNALPGEKIPRFWAHCPFL